MPTVSALARLGLQRILAARFAIVSREQFGPCQTVFANLSSDNMTDTPEYTPPEVWVWEKGDSPNWRYSNTNRPIAGATHEKELPRGKHPLQLYSLGTPNGVKVTIMLEELLAAGHSGAEYDAWL